MVITKIEFHKNLKLPFKDMDILLKAGSKVLRISPFEADR
jgi:hypothetical protein